MSHALERATKRLLHRRVFSVFLLSALTLWLSIMAGPYRTLNRLTALTILAGVVVLTLDLLLLAGRMSAATSSEASSLLVEVCARYAPLIVLNLMMTNVLAPVLASVVASTPRVSFLERALTFLGWLSAQVLFGLFALGIAAVLTVMAMRLLELAARRWPLVEQAATVGGRVVVTLSALYCAWAVLLTLNGSFERGKIVTEHRSEILKVWGVPATPLRWADVRSWDTSGGLKRVLVVPERDHAAPTFMTEGQPVRVRVRRGLFGLAWVESMRLDFDEEIETLVVAAPSAATPRRQLIEVLLRDGRWSEAATQTAAYARYHPGDRELVKRVTSTLRAANQAEPAAVLDRLVVPVSQTRATR